MDTIINLAYKDGIETIMKPSKKRTVVVEDILNRFCFCSSHWLASHSAFNLIITIHNYAGSVVGYTSRHSSNAINNFNDPSLTSSRM